MNKMRALPLAAVLLGAASLPGFAAEVQLDPICKEDNQPIGGDSASISITPLVSGVITDLKVMLRVKSPFPGDLVVLMEHAGTEINLVNRLSNGQGDCNTAGDAGFNDVTLDDAAATPIQSQCAGIVSGGDYSPNQALSAFDAHTLTGTWTMTVRDDVGADSHSFQEWCLIPTIDDSAPVDLSDLVNLSTRLFVENEGSGAAIAGFTIEGTGTKRVLVMANGPILADFGVSGVLEDPTMTIIDQATGAVVASNDDWGDGPNPQQVSDALAALGYPDPDPAEPALVLDLSAGAYTVVVRGIDNTNGVALVSMSNTGSSGGDAVLTNISTRGLVNSEPMIGGFIVEGSGTKRVLVMANGPTLSSFGVTDVLEDPNLTLFNQQTGAVVNSNDNWQDDASAPLVSQAFQDRGLNPPTATEAGFVIDLAPGAYTAVVKGSAGTTGVALVSITEL